MTNDGDKLTRRRALEVGGTALAVSGWPAAGALAIEHGSGAAELIKAKPWSSESPFLRGVLMPVFDERDDAHLAVQGEIPRSLRGVFMRNGPNPLTAPDDYYVYPFDGAGMIHAVYIENGRARYRNRWVHTKELLAEHAAGHRIYNSSFAPPPNADLANTNIILHGGRYLALFEAGVPYELDRNLATVGPFNYNGKLPTVMSAHPKRDPTTGELLSIAYNGQTGALTYLRADKTGSLDRVVPFQAPWPTMIHDIAITERHVVAFTGPAVLGQSRSGPPVSWQPERGSMVAVVPRDATTAADIKWIKGAPFFQFHVMNAFEDGNRIEVTVPWYDSFSLSKPSTRLELHRLVIDTEKNTMADQTVDDRACEFPRVNETHLGRRAQFGYVGLRDPRPNEARQGGAFESIARYDLATGNKVVHQFPAGMTVGESVFVPDPAGKAEADGFIFSFVQDAASAKGSFVILDARDLAARPLATVQLPRRVPSGLHGSWMPA